ncbi:Secondary metabolism regulator LAE1 [Colletotrichum aenigma]|uniref:Secondary metabolism regulator LAE1 n=1 Tax=Colletotrichum aenigma TaxID=1215731 RepID=UPI001872C9E3|nr:Secondary metabolism regulator LAE1 [Colletotrichum aenigma]KAF5512185.1 Secondary metabolism regulator LAE1 [Colletotrichum aenigma]
MASPPQDFEVQVAADEEPQDDTRSEMGSSVASSSTSLRSSLLDYRRENGRTYHRYKDGKYNFPNDERELDRLDLVHHLCLLTLDDRLGIAPPCREDAKVGRVLDVGTGTGIWAIHFGDDHPEADILGVDLSATQPGHVPPNVRFEVDDIEDEWTFSQPFQYIHSRFMTSSIGDWRLFLQRCYDNLEPGGYVELQETAIFAKSDDDTLKPEHALSKWAEYLMEASIKLGAAWVDTPELRQLMVDIGFEDVALSTYKWPTNAWPKDPHFKELGMWNNENFMTGMEAITMAPMTRALEWLPEEVRVFLIDVRKEGNDRNIHAYWPQHILVGRKPAKEIPAPAPEASPAPASPPAPAPAPASAPAPAAA